MFLRGRSRGLSGEGKRSRISGAHFDGSSFVPSSWGFTALLSVFVFSIFFVTIPLIKLLQTSSNSRAPAAVAIVGGTLPHTK